MGWYSTVYNHTLQQHSAGEYKYGRAVVNEIIRNNPGWTTEHVIVGGPFTDGGQGDDFFLINGWATHQLTNIYNEEYGVCENYEIREMENPDVTECSCDRLLNHGVVIAWKNRGYYFPSDLEQVHCSHCHNVWDGYAQCPCPGPDPDGGD